MNPKSPIKLFYHQIIIASVLAIVLVNISCQKAKQNGTTTGNPVRLEMTSSGQSRTVAIHTPFDYFFALLFPRVNALPPPASLVDASNQIVTMTQAWIVIKEIEFKSEESASNSEIDGAEIEMPGPYVVDLFAATPNKIAESNTIKSTIKRIKMKLSKLESSTHTDGSSYPISLMGKSIYLAGAINSNSFSFTTAEESEYEIGGPNGISTSSISSNLLVSINIANLIRKIDLSQVTNGSQISDSNRFSVTNPCPLIDSFAVDIYTCFLKGLKSEANVGKDADGSGEIESNEEAVRSQN